MGFTLGGEGVGRDCLESSVLNFYGLRYDSEDASYARKGGFVVVVGGIKRHGGKVLAGLAAVVALEGCTPEGRVLNELLWTHAGKEVISKELNPSAYPNFGNINGPSTILFFCNSFSDINGDNVIDLNEFFGVNKESYSLEKENIRVVLYNSTNRKGNLILRSWTPSGELIGESIYMLKKFGIVSRVTGRDVNPTENYDFIDKVKLKGPGKYEITATLPDKGLLRKTLTLTE